MKFPLIKRYSNFQLRLGLLKIIISFASRFPATKDGLVSQFEAILSATQDDETYGKRLNYIFTKKYGKKIENLDDQDFKSFRENGHFDKQYSEEPYFLMLLIDPLMPAYEGFISKENLGEMVDLVKALDLMDSDYRLMENAMPMVALIGEKDIENILTGNINYNPLILDPRGGYKEKTFFLIRLLLNDLVFAYLPSECLKRQPIFHRYSDFRREKYSSKSILLDIYQRIESAFESTSLLGEENNFNEIQEYFLGKDTSWGGSGLLDREHIEYRMGKKSSFRHHATPRLEYLVDLCLLERPKIFNKGESEDSFAYSVNENTNRFSEFIESNSELIKNFDADKFIRSKMFSFANYTYDIKCEKTNDPNLILKYFLEGFRRIQRPIGYTPSWGASLLGCLLAQDDKILIEINDMYKAVIDAGKGPFKQYLIYSGGSRFDEEFFMGVNPKIYKELGIDEKNN